MSPKFIIKSAFRALRKHKMRSLLTTLGIIVGIIIVLFLIYHIKTVKAYLDSETDRV